MRPSLFRRPPPLPVALADDLAGILADALLADLKAHPNTAEIQPVPEPSVVAARGNVRRVTGDRPKRRPHQ